jgi:hypothetical protein
MGLLMNTIKSKVILKKLNRLNNINKYAYNLILDICNGTTEIRPVYKIPNKLTIINVFDELISILIKLNINFVVSNTAKRGGQIGILITIKTKVNTHSVLTKKVNINGNNRTKVPATN